MITKSLHIPRSFAAAELHFSAQCGHTFAQGEKETKENFSKYFKKHIDKAAVC